jgi:P-type Ca2+ transporter type 2C
MMDASNRLGLSGTEAARRLAAEGPNALPVDRHRFLGIFLDAVREPMFLLLLGAAALYLALGDLHEGLLLLFMVCLTIGLTLYQEGKTERALEALRDLSSPRALVLRDGQTIRIPGSEVVRGDLLILSEGDRIAADAVLMDAGNLQIDESLLTGEAWPVSKRAGSPSDVDGRPGGENLPFVWSGTLVVRGSGLAQVTATGPRSELGRIGGALQSLSTERSPLQRATTRTVNTMAVAGVALSLMVVGIYGALHGDWLQAILVGIALSMSLLPEEYPVILAVFPAIGAWRLSRVQVLTRRVSTIETLGSVSVLCTDKTGTLTENRMEVVQLHADGILVDLDNGHTGATGTLPNLQPRFAELATFASLASKPDAFDPMEKAFHRLAACIDTNPEERGTGRAGGPRGPGGPFREYPLSTQLRAMSQVWQTESEGQCIVAAKGAPEAIAALCRLDGAALQSMTAAVNDMAARGLRVLAVARAECMADALPESQEEFGFRYLGLLALADPIRKEIPEAIRQCKEAGIRVVMITGDYPVTAESIARQAGLENAGVLTGAELDTLNDAQLGQRLRECSICARITPDQKLRIVQALKADGEIVAMTGDGVNDAPALKAAHVGIAMGGRGTDVAREAASIVLLDDNFASIVRGIRLGRRIFANMQNAMSYVLAMHVPIAGMALLPALFGWPILLFPMHMAFLELIIDPACSLAFENEASEADAMRRPPRDPAAPLLGRDTFIRAVLQGCGAMAIVALSYTWAMERLPAAEARAVAFAVLVVANLGLIFSSLSRRTSVAHVFRSANRVPWLVAGAAIGMLLLVFYIPGIAGAFRFAALLPGEFGAALLIGLSSIVWYELIKFLVGRNARAI